MGEVDVAIIARRFVSLRKHLGERVGENLTIKDLAEKSGIPNDKMLRLEHGKGSWESLLTLLLFYRNQGYNLDWILFPEHESIPMMLSSGNDLLVITEMIKKFSNRLQQDYSEINTQLTKLGYSSLEDKLTPAGVELPQVFDLT